MAVSIEGLFENSLKDKIKNSKLLVIGAGGIGCELLKNLVLTGFEDLEVIDLDTIELSNLNRQFLFHKQHIGKPKAVVARESVLKFNPKANIIAHHDSIFKHHFNVEYFQQFSAVANALDNIAARSHVNRMCLAANVPLVESGSAGYLGNVTVYKKNLTECYECERRIHQRSYPSCTIRNTPSEPVHCITWAKQLFSQLFGECDADHDVSPDLSDPKLKGIARPDGNVYRIQTREWAQSVNYEPVEVFDKLYRKDIQYLHEIKHLWTNRRAPTPLDFNTLPDAVPGSSKENVDLMKDQVVWSVRQCADVFASSMKILWKRWKDGNQEPLEWDKDDDAAMDFVTACANLRSHCFAIDMLSKFETKGIVGRIIPAIATTNAIVSGLVVMQIINILKGDISKCRSAFTQLSAEVTGKLIASCELNKPKMGCFVCSLNIPVVRVRANFKTLKIKTMEDKILKEALGLREPDVMSGEEGNNSGTVLLSSDPDDYDEGLRNKTLSEKNIAPKSRLLCEDFLQQYKLYLDLLEDESLDDQEFKIEGFETKENEMDVEKDAHLTPADGKDSDFEDFDETSPRKKRTVPEEDNNELPPTKKAKADA